MIKKIDHLVITTEKPEACLDFYKQLGFSIQKGDGRFQLFAGDFKINVHIKGQELLPHAQFVMTGSADLCFELDKTMADFQALLRKSGIKSETGVVERHGARGVMHSVYLRDPDGNLLEFCSYR